MEKAMSLSFKEVAEIMKIIDSSSCEELVLEAEGMRLVVRRGGSGSVSPPAAAHTASAQRSASGAAPASTAPTGLHPRRPQAAPEHIPKGRRWSGRSTAARHRTRLRSSRLGSTVSPGDPLCMIEVMKLYTTISASTGGVVEAILADDSALVEFDQPLFLIRPA
jgi:acetyl-CoA carboxylase biotin carboxyl carrier protein